MFPVSSESERFSPVISKEWSEIPGRLNAPFQSRISSESSKQGHAKRMNPAVSTWQKVSFILFLSFNIIQLYCLYVEKFAFWLVIYIKTFNKINNKTSTIYIKTFNKINNKTSTTRWNTELKKRSNTREKNNNIRMHAPTHTHTLVFWLTNNLKHSINYNKTKFLKQQNTKIETLTTWLSRLWY